MKKFDVVVVGSSNTDMVVQLPQLPQAGETVLGNDFAKHHGGKGANQAVAAARADGSVAFIACVGSDSFGTDAIEHFAADGINVDYIKRVQNAASGVALILVSPNGENMIGVASGANACLTTDDIQQRRDIFAEANTVLMQLETPLETIASCVDLAHENACRVILNPAPARALPTSLLAKIDILTPNETEAELLSGVKVTDIASARQAASVLREQGVKTVIITMGAQGAYCLSDDMDEMLVGFCVDAVDSTAAGDTFNGALSVALAQGQSLADAIRLANAAGAIAVTQIGAQPSIPSRAAIGEFMA